VGSGLAIGRLASNLHDEDLSGFKNLKGLAFS